MRLEASRFVAESYFEFHSDKANYGVGTSKKLFSKQAGKPSQAQLLAYLRQGPLETPSLVSLSEKLEATLLPQWRLQLRVGINLALYGYGSKTSLLDRFIPLLNDYHVFRWKTYQQDTSLVSLFQSIARNVFGIERSSRSLRLLTDEIVREQQGAFAQIVLIIEMADAPLCRHGEFWRSLIALAQAQIRLVLTFEHHNSMLLNEADGWARLSLAWHNATTLQPYSEELGVLLGGSSASAEDADRKLEGAKFVLASLTQTGRAVFRVLAEHQLGSRPPVPDDENGPAAGHGGDEGEESGDEGGGAGMSLVTWYQRCQERFLVSNELAFRTQLTEFIDHELVRSLDDLGQNGNEFYIPFNSATIEALLQTCR